MTFQFREVVVVDSEFTAIPGERSGPVCVVAREMRSGRIYRIFQGEFGPAPPYATGPDVLLVCFVAAAEMGVYHNLGWEMPEHVVDLFAEFRNYTNMGSKEDQAERTPNGRSLLGASLFFGLPVINSDEKTAIQKAIGSDTWRGQYTPKQIMDYCQADEEATARLFIAMLSKIPSLPHAVFRGRYTKAEGVMVQTGIPMDVELHELIRDNREILAIDLIKAKEIAEFDIYDENGEFRRRKFEAWLVRNDIPWRRLKSGQLDLEDDTFELMAETYPAVAPLWRVRSAITDLRGNKLAVGHDGRNRAPLWSYGARTGRNTPKSGQFIFGPSVWLRGLIKPPPGYAIAYIDWCQQEFGIAAALSRDPAMLRAYRSGDCHLAFGKEAGLIPADATKETHSDQRNFCKQCVFGVQYGMGEQGLAARIKQPPCEARRLLRAHHRAFPGFWRWNDHAVMFAMTHGYLPTVFDWRVHVGRVSNARSLGNFPMQANGAEMMRLAACLAVELGLKVLCPVHDAFMILAPLDRLEHDIAAMRSAMAEASRTVLNGFELNTDVSITRYPNRYMDKRGVKTWNDMMNRLGAMGKIRMRA